MSSSCCCLWSPTATCIDRVLGIAAHKVVAVVLHAFGTELTVTHHKERPVLIFQREVQTQRERCTVGTRLAEFNLVLVVNFTVTIHVLVFQVTRLEIGITAER